VQFWVQDINFEQIFPYIKISSAIWAQDMLAETFEEQL